MTQRGLSATDVAKALGRTVRWVRKWRQRARSGQAAWYEERPRAPHRQARQAEPAWERAVVDARQSLVARREAGEFAFIGAIAIRRELEARGVCVEGHSLRQIERIVQRHGLVAPRRRRSRGGPTRFYPGPQTTARRPWDLHELDFVGPLYRRGGERLAVLSRLDVVSGQPRSWVHGQQTSTIACCCLWDDWTHAGLPVYLQMDNHGAFVGGLNHPRSIGQVIRLCLYVGVQPVFIPPYSPFYNAHVESYQSLWQDRVWEQFDIASAAELHAHLERFAAGVKDYRAYARALRRRGPVPSRRVRKLRADAHCPKDIPLCWGRIHILRKVAEDGVIRLFNEPFRVRHELAHDYVWAIIDTRRETLTVTHQPGTNQQAKVILKRAYAFRERARRRPPLREG